MWIYLLTYGFRGVRMRHYAWRRPVAIDWLSSTGEIHFGKLAIWLEEKWGLDTPLSEVTKDLRSLPEPKGETTEEKERQRKLFALPEGDPKGARRPRPGLGPVFPVVGRDRLNGWQAGDADWKEWTAAFPALNIGNEIAKAHAWVMANPRNKKTSRGMAAFIYNWLSRAQDRGPVNGGVPQERRMVVGQNPDGTPRYR
jgi:hypothetical protein